MKHVWMTIRLLLPVAAIVLLGLYVARERSESSLLLGGMLCSVSGLWLNIWFQRKERKHRE